MARTARPLSRRTFLAAVAGLVVLNAGGWFLYGQRTILAAGRAAGAAQAAPLELQAALPASASEVDRTDRLTLVFGSPLVPDGTPEKDLPSLAAPPMQVTPELSGHWVWDGPSRLVFMLDEPIGRSQAIRMTPTLAFAELLGRPFAAGLAAEWNSSRIAIRGSRVKKGRDGNLEASVRFNKALTPAEVSEGLSLVEAGTEKGVEFDVLGRGASTEHVLSFDPGAVAAMELSFGEGSSRRVVLPRRFGVTGTYTDLHRQRRGGEVRVYFSEDLDPAQGTPEVTVAPRIEHQSARISGSSVVIEGDFEAGQRYEIQVAEKTLAAGGATLLEPARVQVRMDERSPWLGLTHSSGTLSPHGSLLLSLETIQVPSIQVRATKVLPGNVVAHVRGDSARHTSEEVLSRTFDLTGSGGDAGEELIRRHALDLRGLLGEAPGGALGLFDIEVRAADWRWTRDRATLRITDLGGTVKSDAGGEHVWVQSLTGGTPVAGARVTVLSVQDQVLGSAATDARGYAFVPQGNGTGEPYLVLIESPDGSTADLAYVELGGARWEIPADVARGRAQPRAADVFTYTERSLYRPGDTVYLTGIARTPGGVVHTGALDLVIHRPDGALALAQAVTPDPGQGLFHGSLPTEEHARTGTWQVRIHDPKSGEVVGRTRFELEAFLPARLELSAESATDGEGLPFAKLHGRSLAGTRLDGLGAELVARWTPLVYASTAFPDFSFEPAESTRSSSTSSSSHTLDEHGDTGALVPGWEALDPGLWKASLEWTVTEPGSRSAVASSTLRADSTEGVHRGLRIAGTSPGTVVPAGEAFLIESVALNRSDELVEVANDDLFVSLERLESRWEYESHGGSSRWERRVTATEVWNGAVLTAAPGKGTAEARCASEGEYRVKLLDGSGTAITQSTFWAAEQPDTFRPAAEDFSSVEIVGTDGRFLPGSTAPITLRAPFDGSALLTLEDSSLRWQGRGTVEGGVLEFMVPVPSDLRGDAILSAQVTRALDPRAKTWQPHRSYGWARLTVDHRASEIETEIDAPIRVRPGEEATVTVTAQLKGHDSARSAVVHLWAVDEGIRIAGAHRVPGPFQHYFGPRAHATPTTDGWFTLLPDVDLPGAVTRIGGDADEGRAARRRAPETLHEVPGVVWREAVLMGEGGRSTVTLEVPDFTGELTWLATVVDGDRYGSAQAATTLAGDIPMFASTPRFAAPGDRFWIPVRCENQTEKPATVTPRLAVHAGGAVLRGPLETPRGAAPTAAAMGQPVEASHHPANGELAISLGPSEGALRWFEVEAAPSGTGTGSRFQGSAWLEGSFADGAPVRERHAFDLPIRSGRPVVVASASLTLDASTEPTRSLDLQELLGVDLLKGSSPGTQVTVSAAPSVTLFPAGAYLTDYPHGCAEQTASRVFAVATMHALKSRDDDEEAVLAAVTDRVERGLWRLSTMQTPDGALAYWPGQDRPSPWASLYGAEVLGNCRGLGFDVPESLTAGLVRYLATRIEADLSPSQRAMTLFALASLGGRERGWAARLEGQPEELSAYARTALAAALAKDGKKSRALALLAPTGFRAADRKSELGFDRLASPVRTAALKLVTLLELDPGDDRIPQLVEELESLRAGESGRWSNTVDNAAALGALARYAHLAKAAPAQWSMAVHSGKSPIGDAHSERLVKIPVSAPGSPLEISLEGTGLAYLQVTGTGRAAEDAGSFDRGLRVRRRWLDQDGRPLELSQVRHGQLVFVELELSSSGTASVADVALVDPLPAGFEVEAPELLASLPEPATGDAEAASFSTGADRVEFLDDRVLIYGQASPEPTRFLYALRATCTGVFEQGPVQAEAMYAPETSSVGDALQQIRVSQ